MWDVDFGRRMSIMYEQTMKFYLDQDRWGNTVIKTYTGSGEGLTWDEAVSHLFAIWQYSKEPEQLTLNFGKD